MKVIIPLLLLGIILYSQAMTSICPPKEDVSPCKCIENHPKVDLLMECFAYHKPISKDHFSKVLQVIPPGKSLFFHLLNVRVVNLPSRFFEDTRVKILDFFYCNVDGLTGGEDGKPLAGLKETLEELHIYNSFGTLSLQLKNLNKLHLLRLGLNSIPSLGDDWLSQAPALFKLVLVQNGIEKLGKRAFAGLTSLESLYLTGNRLGPNLKRSMFPNPANKLIELSLRNNSLPGLPNDMFSNMPSLKSVNLSVNRLRRMPKEVFQPVWEQLTKIDMTGNPLECDSHLEWMLELRSPTWVEGSCSSPADKAGIELMQILKRRIPL